MKYGRYKKLIGKAAAAALVSAGLAIAGTPEILPGAGIMNLTENEAVIPAYVYADSLSDNLAYLERMGDVYDAAAASHQVRDMGFTTQAVQAADGTQAQAPARTDTTVTDPATGATTITSEQTLSQSYHQDYDTYELGLNGRYFFYSNVGNGDFTSKPVRIEIPVNMSYSLEKDGLPLAYVQGTEIKNLGSYVLTVSASKTEGTVTTVYVGYYRFRIVEPTQAQIEAEEAAAAETAVQAQDPEETAASVTENMPDAAELDAMLEGLSEEEQETLEAAIERGELTDEELLNPDGTLNRSVIDQLVEEAISEQGSGSIYTTEGISELTGIACEYDYMSGFYQNTLKNSMKFYTDVPNGMITHREVSLRTSDDLTFAVYRDGVLLDESTPTDKFTEPGSYRIVPSAEDVAYYDAYQDTQPYFTFRIIPHMVNDLSIYRAPEGFIVSQVLMRNAPAETVRYLSDDTVSLREDGAYTIEITDGERTIEVNFTLDRVRPRFYVTTQKNKALISFVSEDVAQTIVYKDGKLVSSGTIETEIDGSGNYQFYAVDDAGNRGRAEFTVKYGLNKGAIVAILLLIAGIGGLYAYLRYINAKVKVR